MLRWLATCAVTIGCLATAGHGDVVNEDFKLLAADGAAYDGFGSSVSISGDRAVIGACYDDDNGSDSGSAYVFDLGEPADSDGDGIPDDIDNCDLYNPDQADCNDNGIGDVCDIDDGTSNDANGNGIPDECEDDCNANGIPDDWDIKTGWSQDCNGNLIPDECDIASGDAADCNENFIPDECDIADGTSEDIDGDGVPDECQCHADANGDGVVDVNDLLAIISWWGSGNPAYDLNFDGIVDVSDLLIVIAAWGACP